MKNILLILGIGLYIGSQSLAAQNGGRIYDECDNLSKVTWWGNNRVVWGESSSWIARQGDVYRYALEDKSNYSYLVYDMPSGTNVKKMVIDFYSPNGQKPTLAVKNAQGYETKYVLGWDTGYPDEIVLGDNVKRFVVNPALIPADAVQAVVYMDAQTDVEIMRIVIDYGDGFVQPDYNKEADFARIQNVMAKAADGKDLTIGVIGGSMTAGANADPMDKNCYGARLKNWFETTYGITVKLVNAGIGSTNSYFGAIRAEEHLLRFSPDLVVMEYACNDQTDDIYNHTYEGLMRKLLKAPEHPAVISLMMCTQAGVTRQDMHLPIALHYRVPVVSYNDAVKNDIIAGDKTWLAYYGTTAIPAGDGVHPNNAAHQKVADLIAGVCGIPAANNGAEINTLLPAPAFSADFENAFYLSDVDIQPVKTGEWVPGGAIWDFKTGKGWRSSVANSELVFSVTGDVVAITYWKRPQKELYGRAEVWVDGGTPVVIDGSNGEYIDQLVLNNLGNGFHKLHIKTLDNKPFEVTCIAVSGDRDFFNSSKALQSKINSKLITIDGNNVTMTDVAKDNVFEVSTNPEGYMTFRLNDRFLAVDASDSHSSLIAAFSDNDDAAKFLFVDKGEFFAIRSVKNGKYVSVIPNGDQITISANATSVTDNERFVLKNEKDLPVGLDKDLAVSAPVIYTDGQAICIKNAQRQLVSVYCIEGKLLDTTTETADLYRYETEKGLYLVSVGAQNYKVVVK